MVAAAAAEAGVPAVNAAPVVGVVFVWVAAQYSCDPDIVAGLLPVEKSCHYIPATRKEKGKGVGANLPQRTIGTCYTDPERLQSTEDSNSLPDVSQNGS